MEQKLFNLLESYQSKLESQRLNQYQQGYMIGVQQGIMKAIHLVLEEACCNHLPIEITIDSEVSATDVMKKVSEAPQKPVAVSHKQDKKVVAFRCDDCNEVIVALADLEQPFQCGKCDNWNHFGELLPGSYHCECGAKYRFLQEDSVDKIKCRECGHMHNMIFDPTIGEWKSVDDIRYQD
ncbi:MAG: hypothetical protein K2G70_07035 [Turicibacter sp.]|nr:hypothetical protein [Turicibacter sp.]